MTSVRKPEGPAVSTQKLNEGFDKIREAMEEIQTSRGSVNVAKLEKKIGELNEAGAYKALELIKDEYSTQVSRWVSDCGGRRRVSDLEEPKTLKKEEVQSIFNALIDAKSKVSKLDKNKDGAISEAEEGSGRRLRGFTGELVKAAISGNRQRYSSAMNRWRSSLADTARTMDERVERDDEIKKVASFHAKTRVGGDALTWAFRDLATGAHGRDAVWRMDDLLNGAETGDGAPLLARYRPGDMDAKHRDAGHLDNDEIKYLLGTDDLRGYIQETRAAIEDRVGGSYHRHYLKGKDLPGHDQIDDPDFRPPSRYASSC